MPQQRPGPSGGPGGATMLPLPRALADKIPANPPNDINIGLWLDRYLRRSAHRQSGSSVSDGSGEWEFNGPVRAEELNRLCRRWTVPAGADALHRRRETLNGRSHAELKLRTVGPLLVDAGRVTAMEVSLSMHPIWGVPRIPGTALRGMLRAVIEREGETNLAQQWFGTTDAAGEIEVLDAIPDAGAFQLHLDVLTPHYKAWYRSGSPPGDDQSPEPATFLTVVNTTFVVHVVGIQAAAAAARLRQAVDWYGIGAKTSAGYGNLEVVP